MIRPWRTTCCAAALAAVAAAAAGCATPQQAQVLPRIDEIAPPPERLRPADDLLPDPQGIAAVQMIELPLDLPTDAAWHLVDEAAFPPLTRGMWNANGLRVGLLPKSSIPKVIDALPPAHGLRTEQILGSEHPLAMLRTRALRGVVTVNLTVPPAAPREDPVTGGRLQLLARLVADQGSLALDLLPHHHTPRTLLPEVKRVDGQLVVRERTTLERELAGRVYDELGLRVRVPQSHVLVLGLYRPWPQTEATQPLPEEITPGLSADESARRVVEQVEAQQAPRRQVAPDDAAEADPSAADAPADVDPPPLDNHLGRALLTAQQKGVPLQLLLFVTVEPIERSGVAASPPPGPPPGS